MGLVKNKSSAAMWGMLLVISLALWPMYSSAQTNEGVLKYCVDPDWMPFEGIVNGEHTGIANDYLRLFEARMEFSFEKVVTRSWKETTDKLKSGDCDLTFMLNSSSERETYLSFTLPYFFGPNVLVSKGDVPFMQDINALGDKTLGIVSGYRLLEEIPMYYPDVKIKVLTSEEEGLLALEKGNIDVYVGSLYSINYLIEKLELTSLRINGWVSIQDKLRVGLTKNNADLVPIFNATIEQISTSEHNQILNKWSNVHVVKEVDHTMLYYLGVVAASVMGIFLWRNMVSRRVMNALSEKNQELEETRQALVSANERLEHLSFHDNLTQLYNRHYFVSTLQDMIAQLDRQHDNAALMMIDIDYFKQINDEHGHGVGDKVLSDFSALLTRQLRAADIAARWGGEEFVVLLPDTSKEQSLQLATRLSEAVKVHQFAHDTLLTISIGIAQYLKDDDSSSWLERADKALYQAKNAGRDCHRIID